VAEVRLDPQTFAVRHRIITLALWAQLPLLILVASLGGRGGIDPWGNVQAGQPAWQIWVLWGQIAAVVACAALANTPPGPRVRGLIVTTGLVLALSALLQGTHGLTDLHAYALLLIALIGLYQDWALLLWFIGGIGVHHLVFGWISPDLVFRDPSHQDRPWAFSLLYLAMALGLAAIQMTYWYFSRRAVDSSRDTGDEVEALALAMRHLSDGVAITDPEGVVVWVNPAFTRTTGHSAQEAVGRTRVGLFHGPAAHREHLTEVFDVARHGMDTEVETFTPAGRESWMHVQVFPIPSEQDPRWLVWVERDVTTRHLFEMKTQAAIRRSGNMATALSTEKSLLTSVISTIPHLVYWKDAQLRYRGANEAYLAVRRVDTELTLATRRDDQIPGPDPLDGLREIEAQVLARGEPLVDRALVLNEEDGTQRTYTVSVLPHRVSTGVIDGVIGVGADVTHVSELERQLAQTNRLETIGQVAAGIAHEINTPVQFVSDNTRFVTDVFSEVGPVIRQVTELSEGFQRVTASVTSALEHRSEVDHDAGTERTGETDPTLAVRELGELTGRLTQILGGADIVDSTEEVGLALSESLEGLDRVAKIVRAMKEFSHPGEDLADTDLNRAIESTVQVCRNEWKYVADLELDLDADLGLVPCFVGELQQVLLNMIVNASQAIAERQHRSGDTSLGKITLSTRRRDGSVEIIVSDTGVGMEADVVARAFDPFFTTKPVGKGTGQGLALARSCIVGRHEGTIHADSVPMEGTTFTITLPAP
jgi:PAS domain S-box-containing protein